MERLIIKLYILSHCVSLETSEVTGPVTLFASTQALWRAVTLSCERGGEREADMLSIETGQQEEKKTALKLRDVNVQLYLFNALA